MPRPMKRQFFDLAPEVRNRRVMDEKIRTETKVREPCRALGESIRCFKNFCDGGKKRIKKAIDDRYIDRE